MKRKWLCLAVSLWLFSATASAQFWPFLLPAASSVPVIEYASYPAAKEQPALLFQKNLKYPPLAWEHGIEGVVVVKFKVECSGAINNIEIVRGIGFGLDKEAVRLVRLMPPWEPARFYGQAFDSKVKMPIAFSLR